MSEVLNDDIVGIYRRINRYIEELQKSQSSSVGDIKAYDIERIESYIAALSKFIDWSVSSPDLDLPETSPKKTVLENPPAILNVDNLMVMDLVRLLERGRDEIVNSQSARMASGLIKKDLERIRAILDKCSLYINEYVKNVTPLDMPESTPEYQDSGAGNTGINPEDGQ